MYKKCNIPKYKWCSNEYYRGGIVMNMTVISSCFIVKESIANIFNRIYEDVKVSVINSVDLLKDSDIYDVLFIHIGSRDYDSLNKILGLKSKVNKIVILDPTKNPKILKVCIEGKLDGYVTDLEDEYELKYIVRKIINGSKFYDSDIVEQVMGSKKRNLECILTAREEEVINEVTKGLSNRDIANKLDVTEFTVKKHISNVLEKLSLKNRKDIIIYFSNGYR